MDQHIEKFQSKATEEVPRTRYRYDGFISYCRERREEAIASKLQSALHRFARPIWKLRAVRLFRDRTNLGANPNLWETVRAAIDGSHYFLLVASRESAKRPWVARELNHWLTERGTANLIIILVDGTLEWDSTKGRFHPNASDALPPSELDNFANEPLWIDLRWITDIEKQATFSNPRYLDNIASIAATLQAKDKDQIAGDDVRQRRIRFGLASVAFAIIIAAGGFAMYQAETALEQARVARNNEARALAALAGAALNEGRPVQAVKLALASWPRHSGSSRVQSKRGLDNLINSMKGLRERHRLNLGAPAVSVAFSPDGTRLATGGRDGTARLWDLATGQETARLASHGSLVLSVAFSPDGTLLATGGGNGTARLWDLATGQETARLEGHNRSVQSVAFSPGGTTLATGSADGTARLWDLATGRETAWLNGHGDAVLSVAFSPDGTRLATGGRDGTARLWDLGTGQETARLEGHNRSVQSVAFSPDGTRLATGGDDGIARLWDVATGQQTAQMEGHGDRVQSVAFSPEGTRLATGSSDETARIWDLTTGQETNRLDGHDDQVWSIAFSPNGTRLVTIGEDSTVRLWDLAASQEIARLQGHGSWVLSVAFSPDGTRLATGGNDGTARLWDLATGQETARLEGHGDAVPSVAFSPDGTRLATGGRDGTARLWDLATGQETARLEGHNGSVQSVAFSPDGTRLATGGLDGTARLWRLTFAPYDPITRVGVPPGNLFQIACTWLPWVDGKPNYSPDDITIDEPICNFDEGYDPPLPRLIGPQGGNPHNGNDRETERATPE